MHKILSKILSRFISTTQGTFLPEKSTFNNIIMAKEIVHVMNQKHKIKRVVAFKVDIEKAYHSFLDSLEPVW